VKTSYSGSKYVAILVVRDPTQSSIPETGVFGALPPTYQYLRSDYNNNFSNWYAIANVTFEADVTVCTDCQSMAPILAQSRSHGHSEMLPDALVDETFNLMPEVMLAMATTNITRSSQINRLDNYTISLLARAYQGSWNALNDVVSNATVTMTVTEPFEAVRASISKPRMYAWAAVNLLLTLSGTILVITQAQCKRKPVVDAVLAAIMMDASSSDPRTRPAYAMLSSSKTGIKVSVNSGHSGRRDPRGCMIYWSLQRLCCGRRRFDGQSWSMPVFFGALKGDNANEGMLVLSGGVCSAIQVRV
jgi:hypothetical protein